MRVLFVLPRMNGGGAERVAARIANAFAKSGKAVSIFTFVGKESFYPLDSRVELISADVKISRKNKLSLLLSEVAMFPLCYWKLRKLLCEGKYDIVVSFLFEADVIAALCRLFGIRFKHICSERNDPWKSGRMKGLIEKEIFQHSDLLVCQGKAVADYYHMIQQGKKIIIPNPIDFENMLVATMASKRIVAVGRLQPQKNYPMMIRGFQKIYEEFPDYKLDIYGEGKLRPQLQDLIDTLGLTDRVCLKGARKDVLSEIRDATLFVMTSDYEGFPNALLEAMAMGLPTICTDFRTGVAHELLSGFPCALVPVGDEEALAVSMRNLLSNEALRKRMGEENRTNARKYDIREIVKSWEDAILGICNGEPDD